MKATLTFCLLLLSAAALLGQAQNDFRISGALLENRLTLRINDYVGVGLSALVNANAHKTFVAAQLWLQCGLLR